jgi:hypothetical protein
MSISFRLDDLDLFLAPEISNFTQFDAPDISGKHPEARHWIANHFLNCIFRGQFTGKFKNYAINH